MITDETKLGTYVVQKKEMYPHLAWQIDDYYNELILMSEEEPSQDEIDLCISQIEDLINDNE